MSLPEGYTELTYIESSGTQYIDTGINPSGDTSISIDFAMTDTSADYAVYGCRDSASSNLYMLLSRGNTFRLSYNKTIGSFTQFVTDATQEINALQEKGKVTIGETTVTISNATFECTYNMLLFAAYNGSSVAWKSKQKIFACKIYDSETLVRNYVPCTNQNGEAGLYDLVTKTFYGNDGTGEFIAGDPVGAISILTIVSAEFSTNPAVINQSIVLSVTIVEETIIPRPYYYYVGEIYSGEVD